MKDYWQINITAINKKGKEWKDQFSYQSYLEAVRVISGYKVKGVMKL